MNGLVLAPQAQVPFLVPKIGTQNETLDSDIEEGCLPYGQYPYGSNTFQKGASQINIWGTRPENCGV